MPHRFIPVTGAVGQERGRAWQVAIVGGGPGGLLTALELERQAPAPVRITLFEAADRLGGKLLTPSFRAVPIRYEAGAAEFYDYSMHGHDPLRELVRDLGLPTCPIAGPRVHVDGHSVANLDDLRERLGAEAEAALLAFDARARGLLGPREFYEAGHDPLGGGQGDRFDRALAGIPSPAARRFVETLIHSDLAAEPADTRLGYGLQNYLMNDPRYLRLYRVAGGNDRLVAAVAARLAARVRLRTPVTAIGPAPDGRLFVTSAHGDAVRREAFDAVVLALPLARLAALETDDPRLAGALRRHVRHHDHPAHYLRVTLLFDGPAPPAPDGDAFWMTDHAGGCCVYDEWAATPGADHAVRGWLIAGRAAAEMAALPDAAIVQRVLEAPRPATLRLPGRVLEARVHRWIGAVSALPGGWPVLSVDRRHQPDPGGHPQLFVVGDYLYDSTLNGVADSAAHVAGWLAALCADPPGPQR